MTYKITKKLHITCLIFSFIFFGFLYNFTMDSVNQSIYSPLVHFPTSNWCVNFLLFCIAILYPMSILHECVHAVFYLIFGGKAKIGFRWIYAYTMETTKRSYESYKFIIILLAPLVVMSAGFLLLNNWVGNLIFLFNLVGSSGDMVMSAIILWYGRGKRIKDTDDGFEVIDKVPAPALNK